MQNCIRSDEETAQGFQRSIQTFSSRNARRQISSNTPRTVETSGMLQNYESTIGSGRIAVSRNDFTTKTPMSLQTTGPIKPQVEQRKQVSQDEIQLTALAQRVKRSDELHAPTDNDENNYRNQYKRKHFRGRKDLKMTQQLNMEDQRAYMQSYSPSRRLSYKKELNQSSLKSYFQVMQKRDMSQGPAMQYPPDESRQSTRNAYGGVPGNYEQLRFGQDLEEDEPRANTRQDEAGQTASSLPKIKTPRDQSTQRDLSNNTRNFRRMKPTAKGVRQSMNIGRSGSMPNHLAISAKHDPKGTGVPQTQLITKTKKILPKPPISNRLGETFANSKSKFPEIPKERQSSEMLRLNSNQGGSVPRQAALGMANVDGSIKINKMNSRVQVLPKSIRQGSRTQIEPIAIDLSAIHKRQGGSQSRPEGAESTLLVIRESQQTSNLSPVAQACPAPVSATKKHRIKQRQPSQKQERQLSGAKIKLKALSKEPTSRKEGLVVSHSLIYNPQQSTMVNGKLASQDLLKKQLTGNQEYSTCKDQPGRNLPPQAPVDKTNFNTAGGKVGGSGGQSGTPQINHIKKKALDAATKKLQREKLMPYVPPTGKKGKAPLPTGISANSALSNANRQTRNQVISVRNRSHNQSIDENEANLSKPSEPATRPLNSRELSQNAERRVSSPLKMTMQREGALIKTPSANINPREMLNGMQKNWTTEMKSNISRLSTQKMRANQYAQERASMSTNNSLPSQLLLANQTSLKMYNQNARIEEKNESEQQTPETSKLAPDSKAATLNDQLMLTSANSKQTDDMISPQKKLKPPLRPGSSRKQFLPNKPPKQELSSKKESPSFNRYNKVIESFDESRPFEDLDSQEQMEQLIVLDQAEQIESSELSAQEEHALQQNILANDIFDDTLDALQVDRHFNRLLKQPEILDQKTSNTLSSIQDTAVRESATTVQEDVDGESAQTEKKTQSNQKKMTATQGNTSSVNLSSELRVMGQTQSVHQLQRNNCHDELSERPSVLGVDTRSGRATPAVNSRTENNYLRQQFGDGETTEAFDRLSHDVSGFGERHRQSITNSIDDRGSDIEDDRESGTTSGFDFYVDKITKNLNNPDVERRNLFSPPFKNRNEAQNL